MALFFAGKQAKADGHSLNTPQLRHVFRSLVPSLLLGFITGMALCFHDIRLLPTIIQGNEELREAIFVAFSPEREDPGNKTHAMV